MENYLYLIESFLFPLLTSRLTRNKSQLSKENISQRLALLSVYLFLNLPNDPSQTNSSATLDGVTRVYLFIFTIVYF